jgi:uncharacterized short protein YbdD (DUF466 family)
MADGQRPRVSARAFIPGCLRRLKAVSRQTAKSAWRILRTLSGDDAYEQYLAHWRTHHAAEGGQPLGRKAFFASELQRKWNGVKRCC